MATFILNYRYAQKCVMQSFLLFIYTRRSVEIGKIQWMGKFNILKQLLVFIFQHVSLLAVCVVTPVGGHLFPFGDNHALFDIFI